MIFFYRLITILLYPIFILIIFFRKLKKKEHPEKYKEKIFINHFKINRNENKKLLWFHAASVGEVNSIIPIIKELNNENSNLDFLITTVTLSSSIVIKEKIIKFNNVQHRFFPLDVNYLISSFLNQWKPDIIFLVDSEIWPNLIFSAKQNRIPIALINARITYKTFKKWNFFPAFSKNLFGCFDLCLTSNIETKNFLTELNVKNVFHIGNIKLINKIDLNSINNINHEILNKKKFWFAASTHKGEDNFCLNVHQDLKKKFKSIITIIAPRHIDRVASIERLCDKRKLNCQILDDNHKISPDKEIIIINSFGVLNKFFKYAKSVFVGKSLLNKFKNSGGQNPIEAAALGCKIYHGPYVYNFQEIYNLFEENRISKQVNTKEELVKNLIHDLDGIEKSNQANNVFLNSLSQQILEKTMTKINNFILNNNENTQT